MSIIDTFKLGLNSTRLSLRKNSPDIFVGLGVVAIVAGSVVACKQTMKLKKIIEDHNDTHEMIKEYIGVKTDDGDEYTEEDAKRDTVILYTQTTLKVAANYAIPVGLIGLGIGSVLYSHKLLKDRNIALLGAYNALELALKGYRERVKKEVGEEKEYDLFHNIKRETIQEVYEDENGKLQTRDVEVCHYDEDTIRDHNCYIFGPGNPNYNPDPSVNWWFLKEQMKSLNAYLNMKGKNGFVTKGDALRFLGLKETDPYISEQASFGWINDGKTVIDVEVDPNYGKVGDCSVMIRLNSRPIMGDLKKIENKLLGKIA